MASTADHAATRRSFRARSPRHGAIYPKLHSCEEEAGAADLQPAMCPSRRGGMCPCPVPIEHRGTVAISWQAKKFATAKPGHSAPIEGTMTKTWH